jgi:hypothetical protein
MDKKEKENKGNEENEVKVVILFGKKIPLTKNKLPDLRKLNKEQRDALKSFIEKDKQKEREDIMKEVEAFFNNKQ